MSGIEITIDGLGEWRSIVDPQRFSREMDAAVQRSAEVLRDLTKKMPPVNKQDTGFGAPGIPVAPRYGGTLRQSIQKRRLALMAAEVYVGAAAQGYGSFVHDGTGKMPARPFFSWVWGQFDGEEAVDGIIRLAIDRVLNP